MATEAVPMCSICVDVFRDPVTLPCQHDFCRPCLQMFAEKCKPTTDADVRDDVNDTDQEEPVTVTCPVCRSPADLGSAGLADLPTNITLVDRVRKFQAEDKTCGQDTPKCLVCEDDNSSPAVKYCQTCTILYCQECFSVCHPMRGVLKRHDVIPVEEFLSLGATGEPGATVEPGATGESGATGGSGAVGELEMTAGDPGDPARPIPCDKHSQPLSIFCVTCEEVICPECVADHTDHTVRSIKSACDKLKNIPDDDINKHVKPDAGSAPSVVLFIDGETDKCTIKAMFIVLDGKKIRCRGSSFSSALTQLLASYYIFDIDYPRCFSQVLAILQVFLMQDPYNKSTSKKYQLFLKSLKQTFDSVKADGV